VLDLSNTSLTGQLPAAWFDDTASKAADAALLSRLRGQAAATNSGHAAANRISPASLHAVRWSVRPASDDLLGLTQLQVLRLAGNRHSGQNSFPNRSLTLP
jgi:hypothetical protein